MKCDEFFNLLPEEKIILKLKYSQPAKSTQEVSSTTGWCEIVIKRNERQALYKMRAALKNLGIEITKEFLRDNLRAGNILLLGINEVKDE